MTAPASRAAAARASVRAPDEGVGEDHAPDEVVAEVRLHGGADRFLEQRAPGVLVVDAAAQLVPAGQGFGERGEDPPGDAPGHAVEALPGRVFALAPREPGEGLPGAVLSPAHEEPRGASAALDRGVRGDRAPLDAEAQAEVVHDLPREQADQVGVAREAGVDAGEGAGGDGGAAGVVEPFQHQHGPSGPGQVGGGDQAVVSSADDYGVVGVVSLVSRHGSS
jgi:hypothetical protein